MTENKIISFEQLKKVLVELLRGYPEYKYYGKIEFYFTNTGKKVLEILEEDGIIEIDKKVDQNNPDYYRLTPKGINLAISMITLEHSEEVSKYSKETYKFNKWIIKLTIGLFLIGAFQILLIYFQNPL